MAALPGSVSTSCAGKGGLGEEHAREEMPDLDDICVSTVSGAGSDTGCICCIWSQLAQKQSIMYLLYLEQSWIQG